MPLGPLDPGRHVGTMGSSRRPEVLGVSSVSALSRRAPVAPGDDVDRPVAIVPRGVRALVAPQTEDDAPDVDEVPS